LAWAVFGPEDQHANSQTHHDILAVQSGIPARSIQKARHAFWPLRPLLGFQQKTMKQWSRRLFETYQFAAAAILVPLDALLWWRHYDGNAKLAAIAILVPIVHAYVVPGLGTNVFHVWE